MIKQGPRAVLEETEFSNSNFQAIAQSVARALLLFFTVEFKFPALIVFFGKAMWHCEKYGLDHQLFHSFTM